MMFGCRRTKTEKKKLMIVFGLKQDNYSRDVLFRYLNLAVAPENSVLVVHVEEPIDAFDPNSFHILEDLCKSKKVDYQVKVCTGDSFIAVLVHQVRIHHATILVIGCNSLRPKESVVSSFLKRLSPSCSLQVIDTRGKVLLEKQGISQEGSSYQALKPASKSTSMNQSYSTEKSEIRLYHLKSVTTESSELPKRDHGNGESDVKLPEPKVHKQFQKSALREVKRASKQYTPPKELEIATYNFSSQIVISEDSDNIMYSTKLKNGQDAAIKVLHITEWSGDDLRQEVEILSGLNHKYIVQLIGYCYTTDMHAIVYNLVKNNLKQSLIQLQWSERKGIAVGAAKALEFLHSCSPPVIHRDIRSSNILLTWHSQPLLSGFGAATVYHQRQTHSKSKRPIYAVETSAYAAPEYLMFGKVDEKIDVYSYGVVLLELITGKKATQDLASDHGSLVLQARSLLSRGLCEHLIDPHLNEDYDKEDMERMIMAARLCITHSSSRRPTMKIILQLLEDEEYWLRVKGEREKFINEIRSKDET